MNKKEDYKSKFDGLVRIRKKQIQWLRTNKPKDTRTIAGYLDIIINEHKKQS